MASGEAAQAVAQVQLRQVTGDDRTLVECCDAGVIPLPPLSTFNEWQQWRKAMRPRKAADGIPTTSAQEADLWRATMRHYHSAQWEDLLVIRDAVEDDEDEAPEAAERAASARAVTAPPAAAGGVPGLPIGQPQEAGGPPPAEPIPTGMLTPVAQRGPGSGDRQGAMSPGSGGRASPASWHSASPGSPPSLTNRIFKPYDQQRESLDAFKDRLRRMSQALAALGERLPEGDLERLLAKADYDAGTQNAGHVEGSIGEIRMLKHEYANEMCDIDDSIAQKHRITALEGMLAQRGLDLAALKIRLATGDGITTPAGGGQPRAGLSFPQAGPAVQFRMDQGERTPGQDIPGSGAQSAVLESFEARLKQAEVGLAAQQLMASQAARATEQSEGKTQEAMLATVAETQTALLTKLADRIDGPKSNEPRASTIRVEPKVYWPTHGDGGAGGREAEDFYDTFEGICGLANNGKGMSDKEMLVTLKSCLKDSRKKIYENVEKKHRPTKLIETLDGPGIIYKEIKARLLRFVETATERQMKARANWQHLYKGHSQTALQFEADWERAVSEMTEVGNPLADHELYLSYLVKVGERLSEIIRKDKRMYPDEDGKDVFRGPSTWEEAHLLVIEQESFKAGTKALGSEARGAGLSAEPKAGAFGGGKDSGGKGDKGGGKGKDDKDQLGRDGKPICFNWREKGTCHRGDECRFSHQFTRPSGGSAPAKTAAQKKADKKANKDAAGLKAKETADALEAAFQKGKSKGGGKGGRGGGGGGSPPQAGNGVPEQKKKICFHIKKGEKCTKENCPYGHKVSNFDADWKYIGGGGKGGGKGKKKKKGGGRGGAQEGAEGDGAEDEWGVPGGCGGLQLVIGEAPRTCHYSCPQFLSTKGTGGEDVIQRYCGRQKAEGPQPNDGKVLETLDQLPAAVWRTAESDDSGIQFHTEVGIGIHNENAMLDGGSGVNSVPEELVVKIINLHRKAGIKMGDKDKKHPIASLEKWKEPQWLRGVAASATVELLGAVVFRICLTKVGTDTGPEVLIRFKIMKKGSTDWVGMIIGARCLDCAENGGLGFVPAANSHVMAAYGIQMKRTEAKGKDRPDQGIYAIKCSDIDSDADSEVSTSTGGQTLESAAASAGIPIVSLLYDGESTVLAQGESMWVPIRTDGELPLEAGNKTQAVYPCKESKVEMMPGIWETGQREGMVCIVAHDEFDTALDTGAVVGELHPAAIQTRVCQACGGWDTDSWVVDLYDKQDKCENCGTPKTAGPRACGRCGAPAEASAALTYAGCQDCRLEKNLRGKVAKGPSAGVLASAALSFKAMCDMPTNQPLSVAVMEGGGVSFTPSLPSVKMVDVVKHPVFHIIEEKGMVAHLSDCEVPTEEYYVALAADMRRRHPKVSDWVMEHLDALEPFLDTSIVAGFSYGVAKAFVLVIEGMLLGDHISRAGSGPAEDRTQAIDEFAPLRSETEIRQFVGSSNWVRRYLPVVYAAAVKILGEMMKPTAVIPTLGLGHPDETSKPSQCVKAIKLMCRYAIHTSVMDEAAAIDGSRPLEQIADACGYAWGSSNVQMTADLTGFKVLLMVGKGFTPAQQAWAAVTLEGFAQLGGKRAQKKLLGPMRTLNWTDHANFTKQQQIELADIDLKLLRWVAEITADGSEIRSLSGRAARLGDGTSRNPKDRDELVEQRSKDLKGLIGQVRGFDVDEFLSDWEDPGTGVPWGRGDNSWVEEKKTPAPKAKAAQLSAALSDGTPFSLEKIMASSGVCPALKVLFVPDYVPQIKRVAVTSALFRELSNLLPEYEVKLAISEGPFEDIDGVGAHFEKEAIRGHPAAKREKAIKVDFHSSVIKLARNAAMHGPALIFGEGQGALIAAGYAKPLLLESVLATRNVQPEELGELGKAWGAVKGIVIHDPKVSKTGTQLELLRKMIPELFDNSYPVQSRRVFAWKDTKVVLYDEVKQILEAVSAEVVTSMGSVPFRQLLEVPEEFMWEHNGLCPCGKRSYLFNRCPKCIREESASERQKALEREEDAAKEQANAEAPEVSGGIRPLPNDLPVLPVMRGAVTRDVVFVNDKLLLSLFEETCQWAHGPWHIQKWVHGHDVTIRKPKAGAEKPFRIVFAYDPYNRDLIPVQQCVNADREAEHTVPGDAWRRDSALLCGAYEFSSVSEQLNAHAEAQEVKNGKIKSFSNTGPLRKVLLLIAEPHRLVLVWSQCGGGRTCKASFICGMIEETATQEDYGKGASHLFLFGQWGSEKGARWATVFVGEPRGLKRSLNLLGKDITEFSAWALTWGRSSTQESRTRNLITLYSDKWIVYDRFGSLTGKVPAGAGGMSSCGSAFPGPDLRCGEGRPPHEAPVPYTKVKEGPPDEYSLELTEDALQWYKTKYEERESLADDTKASTGETEFKLGESLRVTWSVAQRADKTLLPMFSAKAVPEGYRIAGDGVLEKLVQLMVPGPTKWVPIVPEGNATAHLTWKRWVWLQCHIGILGAHRSADKTSLAMSRQVWWQGMKKHVDDWVDRCITCLRFRRMPQKQEAVAVIPTDAECWEEVMVDLEGPSHPLDRFGNRYSMTYICCLCHGLLTDRSVKCNMTEGRRMFACCMFRSGRICTLLRTDRGPEFKNCLMAEYTALVGVGHRFGTPWRPMEQGLVENVHRETQKIIGLLVKDILACNPDETNEVQYLVEYIIYNTPGPHGYTPRDIDRRWSAATPLERELQPFQVSEFEPISEYAAKVFQSYRDIKVRVQGWLRKSSEKRAELANRFRRHKELHEGQKVVLRDPRQRKAGGRTPWRQPYTDPSRILEVHGNKMKLQKPDGTILENIHFEDVLLVPESIQDPENELFPEDDSELYVDGDRRSPGKMIEDKFERRESGDPDEKVHPGKLEKISSGNFVLYKASPKKCGLGKVTNISRAENKVIVHVHRPVSDSRLRLYWIAAYSEGGEEVLGSGKDPVLATLTAKEILWQVQVHDGVIAHSAARQLDKLGYKYDPDNVYYEGVGGEYSKLTESTPLRLAPSLKVGEKPLVSRAEEFVMSNRGPPEVVSFGAVQGSVSFATRNSLQKWLTLGVVDFAEIFRGLGEATIRVRETGCSAAEGFDKYAITYGRTWHLEKQKDQEDCAYLLVFVLRPKVVHLGTPCTDMCTIGAGQVTAITRMQNKFTLQVMQHQESNGLGASVENPKGSLLFVQPEFVKEFGERGWPIPPWRFYESHGCQLKVVYPGRDDPGKPIQKAQVWLANFNLETIELRCRKPLALVPATHVHRPARGGMYVEGIGSCGVANFTGAYTPVQGTVYGKHVSVFCRETPRGKRIADSALSAQGHRCKVSEIQNEPQASSALALAGSPDPHFDILQGGLLRSLDTGELCGLGRQHTPPRPVDQFHKVKTDESPVNVDPHAKESEETESEARKREVEHEGNIKLADQHWKSLAEQKKWDQVIADMSVYRYCGEKVTENPRLTKQYQADVLKGLRYGPDDPLPEYLTKEDKAALVEVLERKAPAFWLEGSPRTTLKYLLHDTIPTGPPCRTPPHRLRGEEADWVDEQLQKEVDSGQLVRGNSEWGSPPFATKSFAEHRRQRKRRLVVDYRRVNQRVLRAIYHVRNRDHVVHDAAGSAAMTFVDACKGFNQIANTKRAREVLAILARSGQFLPQCLTFGPHNGPEDFAFATDRIFAPGRGRKQRFCTNWLVYADDVTVRTGRVLEGVIYSDAEYGSRVREAVNHHDLRQQELHEAFKALGFNPDGLGEENKKPKAKAKAKPAQERSPTDGEKAAEGLGATATGDPSPRAHPRNLATDGPNWGQFVWLLRRLCMLWMTSTVAVGSSVQFHNYLGPSSRTGGWSRVHCISRSCFGSPLESPPPGRFTSAGEASNTAHFAMGRSNRSKRGGLGGEDKVYRNKNVFFGECFSAGEYLGAADWHYCRRDIGNKLEKWPRRKLVSFRAMTLARHGAGDFKHGYQTTVKPRKDGTYPIEEFLNLRSAKLLEVTLEEALDIIASEDPGDGDGKIRFHLTLEEALKDEQRGVSGWRYRVDHGHSGDVAAFLSDAPEEVFERAHPGDARWLGTLLHGTMKPTCAKIEQEGLKRGGDKGPDYRGHVHLVGCVDPTGNREGVKRGTDALVRVDARKMYDAGIPLWFGKGKRLVVLTEGINYRDNDDREFVGIPPEFIIGFQDRFTGASFNPGENEVLKKRDKTEVACVRILGPSARQLLSEAAVPDAAASSEEGYPELTARNANVRARVADVSGRMSTGPHQSKEARYHKPRWTEKDDAPSSSEEERLEVARRASQKVIRDSDYAASDEEFEQQIAESIAESSIVPTGTILSEKGDSGKSSSSGAGVGGSSSQEVDARAVTAPLAAANAPVETPAQPAAGARRPATEVLWMACPVHGKDYSTGCGECQLALNVKSAQETLNRMPEGRAVVMTIRQNLPTVVGVDMESSSDDNIQAHTGPRGDGRVRIVVEDPLASQPAVGPRGSAVKTPTPKAAAKKVSLMLPPPAGIPESRGIPKPPSDSGFPAPKPKLPAARAVPGKPFQAVAAPPAKPKTVIAPWRDVAVGQQPRMGSCPVSYPALAKGADGMTVADQARLKLKRALGEQEQMRLGMEASLKSFAEAQAKGAPAELRLPHAPMAKVQLALKPGGAGAHFQPKANFAGAGLRAVSKPPSLASLRSELAEKRPRSSSVGAEPSVNPALEGLIDQWLPTAKYHPSRQEVLQRRQDNAPSGSRPLAKTATAGSSEPDTSPETCQEVRAATEAEVVASAVAIEEAAIAQLDAETGSDMPGLEEVPSSGSEVLAEFPPKFPTVERRVVDYRFLNETDGDAAEAAAAAEPAEPGEGVVQGLEDRAEELKQRLRDSAISSRTESAIQQAWAAGLGVPHKAGPKALKRAVASEGSQGSSARAAPAPPDTAADKEEDCAVEKRPSRPQDDAVKVLLAQDGRWRADRVSVAGDSDSDGDPLAVAADEGDADEVSEAGDSDSEGCPSSCESQGSESSSDSEVEARVVLTGARMIDLLECAEAREEEDYTLEAGELLKRLEAVEPGLAERVAACNVPLKEVLKDMRRKGVMFATGTSDDENIRDYDSGPGPVRKVVHSPYFYTVQDNCEGVAYRRRFVLEARCESDFGFVPEVDSDKEGRVKQRSFIIPATMEVDPQTGSYAGPAREVQPWRVEGQPVFPTNWDPLGVNTVRSIADMPKPIDKTVVNSLMESSLKSVDHWATTSRVRYIESILDLGHEPAGESRARDIVGCAYCDGCLFGAEAEDLGAQDAGVRPGGNELCLYCDEWVHHKCREPHLCEHGLENFCAGLRKAISLAEARRPETVVGGEIQLDEADYEASGERTSAKKKRAEDQGESSGEERLEPATFCKGCGSPDCFRPGDECKYSKRLLTFELVVGALIERNYGQPTTSRLEECAEILRGRRSAVTARDDLKASWRERRASRLQSDKRWFESDVGQAAESGDSTMARIALRSFRGQTSASRKAIRDLESGLAAGHTYGDTSYAASLMQMLACDGLREAALRVRNPSDSVCKSAAPKVLDFLGNVTRRQMVYIGHWAPNLAQSILMRIVERSKLSAEASREPIKQGLRWLTHACETRQVDYEEFKDAYLHIAHEDINKSPVEEDRIIVEAWSVLPKDEPQARPTVISKVIPACPFTDQYEEYFRWEELEKHDPTGRAPRESLTGAFRINPELGDCMRSSKAVCTNANPLRGMNAEWVEHNIGARYPPCPTCDEIGSPDSESKRCPECLNLGMPWKGLAPRQNPYAVRSRVERFVDTPDHRYEGPKGDLRTLLFARPRPGLHWFHRQGPGKGDSRTDEDASVKGMGDDRAGKAPIGSSRVLPGAPVEKDTQRGPLSAAEVKAEEEQMGTGKTAREIHCRRKFPKEGDWIDHSPSGPPQADGKDDIQYVLPDIHAADALTLHWECKAPQHYKCCYIPGMSPKERAAGVLQEDRARAVTAPPESAHGKGLSAAGIRQLPNWRDQAFEVVISRKGEHKGHVSLTIFRIKKWSKNRLRAEKHSEKLRKQGRLTGSKKARTGVASCAPDPHEVEALHRIECAALGRARTREEQEKLTGVEMDSIREGNRVREREDAARGAEADSELHGYGAWICSRCRYTNPAENLECNHTMKKHLRRGMTAEQKEEFSEVDIVPCQGSVTETWGGYARTLERFQDVSQAPRRRGGTRDRELLRQRRLDLQGTLEEGDPNEGESAGAAARGSDRARRARRNKVARQRSAVGDMGGTWPCSYCHVKNAAGLMCDTMNFLHTDRCYKCSRPKQSGILDRTRWVCSVCHWNDGYRRNETLTWCLKRNRRCLQCDAWYVEGKDEVIVLEDVSVEDAEPPGVNWKRTRARGGQGAKRRRAAEIKSRSAQAEQEEPEHWEMGSPGSETSPVGDSEQEVRGEKRKADEDRPVTAPADVTGSESQAEGRPVPRRGRPAGVPSQAPRLLREREGSADGDARLRAAPVLPMSDEDYRRMKAEGKDPGSCASGDVRKGPSKSQRVLREEAEATEDAFREARISESVERNRNLPPPTPRGGGGPGLSRGGATCLMAFLILGLSMEHGETVAIPEPTHIGVAALATGAAVVTYRGLSAVDYVVSVAENKTADVITAVGDVGVTMVPVVMGLIVTLLLLGTKILVQKAKDRLKNSGYNPEGNVGGSETRLVAARTAGPSHVPRGGESFPLMNWVTQALLRARCMNMADASATALERGRMIRLVAHRGVEWTYKVMSRTTTGRAYTVKLTQTDEAPVSWQAVLRCQCPGYMTLVGAGLNVCYHCCAVAICCMPWVAVGGADELPWVAPPIPEVIRSLPAPTLAVHSPVPKLGNSRAPSNAGDTGSSRSTSGVVIARMSGQATGEGAVAWKARPALPAHELARRGISEAADREARLRENRAGANHPVLEIQGGTGEQVGSARAVTAPPPAAPSAADLPITDAYYHIVGPWVAGQMSMRGFSPRNACLIGMLDGRESQDMAVRMCEHAEAGDVILATGFTLDYPLLVNAVLSAAMRGCRVRWGLDKNHVKGASCTLAMRDRLASFLAAGDVVVYACGGEFGGVQHSKSLCASGILVFGSTNWTRASRTNTELNVAFRLNEEGKELWSSRFAALTAGQEQWGPQMAEGASATASQAASAEDRLRNERRFSIARSRASSAGPRV